MSSIYEEYHRIIERLVAGDAEESSGEAGQPSVAVADDAVRAAFIRVMREELGLPDRS